MDKKKLRNDLILIGSLLLVTVISLVVVICTRIKTNLVARVYVQNKVVEVIDLNKNEERTYKIEGLNGYVYVHAKKGAVKVSKSNCPHQDCVHMGYVTTSGRPIICAYNAVSVVIEGSTVNDAEIG